MTTSAAAEARWGRLFYYTDTRITLELPSSSSKAPAGVSAPTEGLLTHTQKTEGKNKGSSFLFLILDSLTDKTGAAPDLEGHNLKETNQGEKKNICRLQSFSATCRWLFFVSLSRSSYKKCFNVFSSGVRRGSVMCFLVLVIFIFYSPCTEKVVSYLLTCCLNCPVLCVQPPSPPHCDCFICTYC